MMTRPSNTRSLSEFIRREKYRRQQNIVLSVVVASFLLLCGFASQINLTTQVQGILPSANGGTANAFFTVSGPATSAKTLTFPNASATVLTDNALVTMAQGGTGLNTLAADTFLQGTGSAIQGATIPTCSNASTSKLLYNTSTHDFTCGTDQTSAISFADNETPSGTIDGTNVTFTLANTPSPAASLKLFKNGQLLIPGGVDYTLTTNSVAYTAGAKPLSGDVHRAYYRF